jgi:hypothetical protein
MKIILVLALIVSFLKLHGETTTAVASRLGFYDYINKLRSESQNFLNEIERDRKAEIQHLVNLHQFGNAEEKTIDLREEYDHLVNELDGRFSAIDNEIVLGGEHMDRVNAPIHLKEALVNQARRQAELTIGHYVRTYHGQHRHR